MRPSLSASGAYATVAARAGELRQVLTTSALFGDAAWEEEVLADVVAQLTTVVVRSGEVVVREGEASDDLLLVLSGRLRVGRGSGEAETVLAELGRGETVGETGLITGDPRSATVYAIRDSVLARLTRERYDALCRRHPLVMMERFAGGTLRRLVQEARGERRPAASFRGAIALVPADADVPLEPFGDELARNFGAHGATLAIDAATCDAVLGREGASAAKLCAEDEAKLARWLAEREREHRFLLYRAGHDSSPWTSRCVRQADHLVVVARAGARPRPATLDAGADAVRRRTSLVLLHDGSVVRRGTAAAWAGSGAEDLHHIRRGVHGDTARLARLLAGEGVALVFGGGGARAFAAAGVARALLEEGGSIDAVCGVSAGAVVAALFAMGLGYEELMRRCGEASRRTDYTVPVYALTTGRNWSATLGDLYGDARIEDLLLPFFCASANVSTAELVVHDRGPLLHAVRASTAIPGILPPVWHEGDLLVDGGLMNNLPIDLARGRRGVGRVLAVSVSPERGRERREPFGYHLSGWRGLAARLTHRGVAGLPTATALLMQSMLVADARTQRRTVRLADWIFHPPARGYSLMDWPHIAAIAESGYRYASQVLRDEDARAVILGEAIGSKADAAAESAAAAPG